MNLTTFVTSYKWNFMNICLLVSGLGFPGGLYHTDEKITVPGTLAPQMNDGFRWFKENLRSHNYQMQYEHQHGKVYCVIITKSIKERFVFNDSPIYACNCTVTPYFPVSKEASFGKCYAGLDINVSLSDM